jgi:hypothetical protein
MKFIPLPLLLALFLVTPALAKTAPKTADVSANAGVAGTTDPAPARKKRRVTRHGYGFLPGVRTPEQIQFERDRHYYASGPHYYGPAWPGFYRGRWNGGGFGPCYTQTPIGPVWNCGR